MARPGRDDARVPDMLPSDARDPARLLERIDARAVWRRSRRSFSRRRDFSFQQQIRQQMTSSAKPKQLRPIMIGTHGMGTYGIGSKRKEMKRGR